MIDFSTEIYQAYMGKWPKTIPHWEHWSNPDAESELAGVSYYDHPKRCRERMAQRYPELNLPIPETDAPIPRPEGDDVANHRVRWGDGQTSTFLHGEQIFKREEDVFRFSPLEHADMRGWPFVVEAWDFRSEQSILDGLLDRFPDPFAAPAPKAPSMIGFYNTTFMWPLLTFGWEMFLNCCLDERFERIMDEFAEINRRVFRAFARLPVNFVLCHDDIATARGPVCSPKWMRKYVYPRYEEYWSIVKAAGKQVIFMADGNMNELAEDVLAVGARGIISEPYTDYKAIARRHSDCFLAGEGDNRILRRNDAAEIRAMVDSMVETARLTGGYMMCVGNHIPYDIPAEAVRRYLELSREKAVRP